MTSVTFSRQTPTAAISRIVAATVVSFGVLLSIATTTSAGEFSQDKFAEKPVKAPLLQPGRPETTAPAAIAGPTRIYIARPDGTWLMILMKPTGVSFVAGRGSVPFEPRGPQGRPLTSSITTATSDE